MGFPASSTGKESTCTVGDPGAIPGLGRSPGEGTATHSSITKKLKRNCQSVCHRVETIL